MTPLVVDTSIVAKWYLIEHDSGAALAVLQDCLQGNLQLHAPSLLYLELDNVVCKRVCGGHLRVEPAKKIRSEFKRAPIQVYPVESLRDAAFDLAMETRQSVYDCIFLALALTLGAKVLTADLRFRKGLRQSTFHDSIVGLVEHFGLH